MNPILELFADNYMLTYFRRQLLPLYPEFTKISSIRIIPYKKHVWVKTYHVVVQFLVMFEGSSGKMEREIFCSAHSDEPRQEVLRSLNFLWDGGFSDDELTIPRPLFFSKRFKGVFYEGLIGDNLHHYLYKRDFVVIRETIIMAAKWFAKLHKFNVPVKTFNRKNSRLKTVLPGMNKVLQKVSESRPEYLDFYTQAYKKFVTAEEKFLSQQKKLWLIHGDAHPDNVIRTGEYKIGLIDFTDLSVSDLARDLGCFKQQLEYMSSKEGYTSEEISELDSLFFQHYFLHSSEELTESLQKRIELYYNWTAVRTLSYLLFSGFLEKSQSRENKIKDLVNKIKERMNLG
jgi:thiamine kinase-like enzyme